MELQELLDDSHRRRLWLLIKALETLPIERALTLARDAEQFVLADEVAPRTSVEAVMAPSQDLPSERTKVNPGIKQSASRLALSPSQREQFLRRLRAGATNAELAAEFKIGARQVQGLRMGMKRTAANIRRPDRTSPQDQYPLVSATAEEVVRYLRQQDDIVVPAGQGEFIVNTRLHLGFQQLVERANRMRHRQNRPLFEISNSEVLTSTAFA